MCDRRVVSSGEPCRTWTDSIRTRPLLRGRFRFVSSPRRRQWRLRSPALIGTEEGGGGGGGWGWHGVWVEMQGLPLSTCVCRVAKRPVDVDGVAINIVHGRIIAHVLGAPWGWWNGERASERVSGRRKGREQVLYSHHSTVPGMIDISRPARRAKS